MLKNLESIIQDNIVITYIQSGTGRQAREDALERARKLAKGASTKSQKYTRNWAEYHRKKKSIATLKLL